MSSLSCRLRLSYARRLWGRWRRAAAGRVWRHWDNGATLLGALAMAVTGRRSIIRERLFELCVVGNDYLSGRTCVRFPTHRRGQSCGCGAYGHPDPTPIHTLRTGPAAPTVSIFRFYRRPMAALDLYHDWMQVPSCAIASMRSNFPRSCSRLFQSRREHEFASLVAKIREDLEKLDVEIVAAEVVLASCARWATPRRSPFARPSVYDQPSRACTERPRSPFQRTGQDTNACARLCRDCRDPAARDCF